jgi:two-component system, sensor histidine kinase PdtaS
VKKVGLVSSDEGFGFDVRAVASGIGTRLVDGSVRLLDGHNEFDTRAGTWFSATVTLA